MNTKYTNYWNLGDELQVTFVNSPVRDNIQVWFSRIDSFDE